MDRVCVRLRAVLPARGRQTHTGVPPVPAFVIAYDVSNPKRLRRVARTLERRAVRVQYSVFLFRGERAALAELMEDLRRLIRPDEDVVQAWPVPPGVDAGQYALGAVRPVRPAAVVVASVTRFVTPPPSSPQDS